jgi:cytosine/adenosine deaminase-related metal-dependent hydrolase
MAELELPTDFVHGLFVDGLVRVERTAQAPASRALYMLTAAGAKAIGRRPALIRPA